MPKANDSSEYAVMLFIKEHLKRKRFFFYAAYFFEMKYTFKILLSSELSAYFKGGLIKFSIKMCCLFN